MERCSTWVSQQQKNPHRTSFLTAVGSGKLYYYKFWWTKINSNMRWWETQSWKEPICCGTGNILERMCILKRLSSTHKRNLVKWTFSEKCSNFIIISLMIFVKRRLLRALIKTLTYAWKGFEVHAMLRAKLRALNNFINALPCLSLLFNCLSSASNRNRKSSSILSSNFTAFLRVIYANAVSYSCIVRNNRNFRIFWSMTTKESTVPHLEILYLDEFYQWNEVF